MSTNSAPEFVLRPFEGLPGEPDWVALREIVPTATATARTTAAYGAKDVTVVTVLPTGMAALHRNDGAILLAVQTLAGSGDASRDVAAVLLRALDAEPGTSIQASGVPQPGPRLQDVLDPDVPFEVTVQHDFSFWLDPTEEVTSEVRATLEESAASIIPTVKLDAVPSAYWCRMNREFLRWARPEPEEALIDALARLQATREARIADGKFIGAFRSCGLLIPVWELPQGTAADQLDGPAVEFDARLSAALAVEEPLNAAERRARAGIVSRQVTLR